MTTCFVQVSGTIELYFYDELDARERAEAERHLTTCADCRRSLEELRLIRSALAARPDVASPPGGDWTPFMERLDDAIRAVESAGRGGVSGSGWRGYVGYMAMAALLALVTLSIAYVIRSRPAQGPDSTVSGPQASPAGGQAGVPEGRPWTEDTAFASLSEQHFERAKLVVLGLASKDPAEARVPEWEYERELASTLLADTRLYRLAAEERGMTSLARIMGDLELVLLQASLSGDSQPATLAQIQSLIRKRDLVTRMNVVAGM
jgi:hypothetical protein